jgi:threonyl-tRNA synthetase
LGYAIEKVYPNAKLTHGPPIEQGFFYDFAADGKVVTEDDYPELEKTIK